jgi:hypothetical protein
MQQKGYDPDADQLHDFVERIGMKMDSEISEDDARKQAIEGR